MTTKLYNLCVATRRYKDNTGAEKAVWENVGSVLENDDSKIFVMLKAHFNPAAIQRKENSESILVSMFPPKSKDDSVYHDFSGSQALSANNYDLCVATRHYKDNLGNEKAVWENVGAIRKNNDGKPFMLLKGYFNPAGIQRKEGSESILVSIFTHKSKAESNQDYSSNMDFAEPDSFQPDPYNPDIPF